MRPGAVIWFTGRPASGKTTLALALRDALHERGIATVHLDSDHLRTFLTPEPEYTDEEREWFYSVVRQLAVLGQAGGAWVLVSATAPLRRHREPVREEVERFFEIYVDADEEVLRRRDPKGLYAAADAGRLKNLPGVDGPWEPPPRPDVRLRGDGAFDAQVAELQAKLLGRSEV